MPYPCEVYPTFRFDVNLKPKEVGPQKGSPAELSNELMNSLDSFENLASTELLEAPLNLTGAFETFEYFDVTPTIGKEFPEAKLAEWLEAANADELIRDLAVTSKSLFGSLCLAI